MDVHKGKVLSDITNVNYVNRKRLSNGELKSYKYIRKPRKSIDCNFDNEAKKLSFDVKYESLKEHLKIKSNADFLDHLIDFYTDKCGNGNSTYSDGIKSDHDSNESDADLDLFVCSKAKLFELVRLSHNYGPLEPEEMTKIGHVARIVLKPIKFQLHPIFWHSSSSMKQDYTINYRLVHAYLCAGLYPAQYERFCDFSCIGTPLKRFRESMFPAYRNAGVTLRDKSIDDAVKREQELNLYDDQKIDVMTDARHACRKNSYHTDVTALGQCTHQVVGYYHVTKEEERSSQKHELYGTKKLYEQFGRKSIEIKVHSHDRNASVSKYIEENQPGVIDSYDTWHGAKEVRKTVRKVTCGPQKNRGRTWHPELRDKLAGVKTHVYWAMKNCNGDGNQLRRSIDNIAEHYKQNHNDCHPTSGCQQNEYVPSRDIIRDPIAESLLRNAIRSLYIYKHPEKYTHCRDTHYIESYHNTILIHIDKRLHFHSMMYDIKVGIAILDWNEHVDRPASSVQVHVQHDHPRRRSGYRVLKPKSYTFVERLWKQFFNFVTGIEDFGNINDLGNADIENAFFSESDDDSDDSGDE